MLTQAGWSSAKTLFIKKILKIPPSLSNPGYKMSVTKQCILKVTNRNPLPNTTFYCPLQSSVKIKKPCCLHNCHPLPFIPLSYFHHPVSSLRKDKRTHKCYYSTMKLLFQEIKNNQQQTSKITVTLLTFFFKNETLF